MRQIHQDGSDTQTAGDQIGIPAIETVDLTGESMEEGYEELLCAVYGIPKIDKPNGGRTPSWIENRMWAARKTDKSEKTKVEALTRASGRMEARASQSGDDGRDVNNQIDQTDYSHITKPALGKTPEWVKDEIESSKPQYHVGDTIHFGSYPYEADGEKKKLEWRILGVEKDRILIITQDLIECAPYNKDYKAVTWESCTLRKWMNGEFMDVAFDEKEKSRIVSVINSNPDNKIYETKGGRKTEDRVFALSIDEVRRYIKNDSDRMAAPTPYVEEKYKDEVFISGPYKVKGRGTGWWWLRSPGIHSRFAADVHNVGGIGEGGHSVDITGGSVRPALWLNLNIFSSGAKRQSSIGIKTRIAYVVKRHHAYKSPHGFVLCILVPDVSETVFSIRLSTVFENVFFQSEVDIVFLRGAARYAGQKTMGASADSKLSCLFAVSLADGDWHR